jgi:hypothetical protein
VGIYEVGNPWPAVLGMLIPMLVIAWWFSMRRY